MNTWDLSSLSLSATHLAFEVLEGAAALPRGSQLVPRQHRAPANVSKGAEGEAQGQRKRKKGVRGRGESEEGGDKLWFVTVGEKGVISLRCADRWVGGRQGEWQGHLGG